MTYAELQQAIIDDSKRDDYDAATIQRFIAEGEARILAKVEAYTLTQALTDADRTVANGNEYGLDGKLVAVRYVFDSTGMPLERVDETLVSQQTTSGSSTIYVPREASIAIAGTPGAGATFSVKMFGLPDSLSVTPTNTLLNDFPQLYKNAALISLFQRAHDYEAAQAAFDDFVGLCNEINRKIKKLLGGRRSANTYNVENRSSY